MRLIDSLSIFSLSRTGDLVREYTSTAKEKERGERGGREIEERE